MAHAQTGSRDSSRTGVSGCTAVAGSEEGRRDSGSAERVSARIMGKMEERDSDVTPSSLRRNASASLSVAAYGDFSA